jgi:hypothetical protein
MENLEKRISDYKAELRVKYADSDFKKQLCAKYNLDINELNTRVFTSEEFLAPRTLDDLINSDMECGCEGYPDDIDLFCKMSDIEELFNMKVGDVLMHESGEPHPTIDDVTRIA